MTKSESSNGVRTLACGLGLLLATFATGCQIHSGGQTLPSAYYLHDDVQYFAPGTEFSLDEEVAAMNAHKADQEAQGR